MVFAPDFMKYEPASTYSFECEISTNGVQANEVEKSIKEVLKKIIKNNNPNFVSLSNENCDKKNQRAKMFSIIEDLQVLNGLKIIHIGRIPDNLIDDLKEEMKDNDELNDRRARHLKDCVIISVKDSCEKIISVVIDRRGIYCLSKKISNSK